MIQSPGRRTNTVALALFGLLAGVPLAVAPLPGLGTAMAQEGAAAVQDVTLQDVNLRFGATRVIVPVLTVSGTRLSRDDLQAILRVEGSEPWPTRLARLDAGSLVAPEIRVEADEGGTRQRTTYRDVTARGIRAGRAAEINVSGATLQATGADPAATGTGSYGRIQAQDVDLAAIARLSTQAGEAAAPLQRLYAAFSIDTVVFGDADTTVTIASVSGHDLAARAVPATWGGTIGALADLEAPEAERRAKAAGIIADAIQGVSVGRIEMTGLAIRTVKDKPAELGVGRLTYAGGAEAGASLSDITFAAAGARAHLASLKLAGVSLAPTVATLRRLAQTGGGEADARKLMPALGTLSLADLSLDLPREARRPPGGDPLAAGAAAPPLHLALREAAMTFEPTETGPPVAGRLSLSGLTLPGALVTDVPVLGALPLYGYRDLDLDLVADTAWNEGGRELALRELSLTGKEMGSLRLSGTLGGIGPDIFDPDATVSGYAMLAATAKGLDLTVRNGGLFERFIDTTAKSLSLKPDELRKEYVTASLVGVPVILGNSPTAKAIGAAVGKFVSKPDTLTIHARAKNGRGLGVIDFSAAPTPAAILDKLEVEADAK